MQVQRLPNNPIIHPGLDQRMAEHGHANINGPSLIRVPDWIPDPLGRYYLYFAHHQGTYIRLAWADDLAGPWNIHEPGTLQLNQTRFTHHIASPDVHVDHDRQRIRMYFHGCGGTPEQSTCVAFSPDGLRFHANDELLGLSYFRVFTHDRRHYALVMPGRLMRSRDGITDFQPGPAALPEPRQCRDADGTTYCRRVRHMAVQHRGESVRVIFSRVGDEPERLLYADMPLTGDWTDWRCGPIHELLQPEHDWEGADQPLVRSRDGAIHQPARQLRDPAVFEDDGRTYLLYAVAGERGIAIAELIE